MTVSSDDPGCANIPKNSQSPNKCKKEEAPNGPPRGKILDDNQNWWWSGAPSPSASTLDHKCRPPSTVFAVFISPDSIFGQVLAEQRAPFQSLPRFRIGFDILDIPLGQSRRRVLVDQGPLHF